MRRFVIVALIVVVAVILAAMVLLPESSTHSKRVVVPLRDDVQIQVCPPLCGPPEPTTTEPATTTVAPPTPTTVPPEPETVPPPPTDPPPVVASPGATGGARSYAWWHAIAVCETGNDPPTDNWRTGYFGLEGGQPEGGRGWDAELAEAESIYRNYGDSAWGCAPVAWAAVPGG